MVCDNSEDLALEGELAEAQKHLVVPMSIVIGLHVEDGVDERADVLEADGLGT